jgi:hypothetical protein
MIGENVFFGARAGLDRDHDPRIACGGHFHPPLLFKVAVHFADPY